MGLMVEPGGYCPEIERLNNGRSVSLFNWLYALVDIPFTNKFGS